jgi:hypothetical protein
MLRKWGRPAMRTRDGTAGLQLSPERAARDQSRHDRKRERAEQGGARALSHRFIRGPQGLFATRRRFVTSAVQAASDSRRRNHM